MLRIRRVLCPIDFSEPSRRALRQAIAVARWHEAELTVLHVEDGPLAGAHGDVARRFGYKFTAEDELLALVDTVASRPPQMRAVVLPGDPVDAIVQRAGRNCDLIVIGTRGRSGVSRLLLGSVAEGVVRRAPCPVMTIPADADAHATGQAIDPFDPVLCACDFSAASRKALDLAIAMAQEADARLLLVHTLQFADTMPLQIDAGVDRSDLRTHAIARLKRGLPDDAVFRCRPEVLVVDGHPAETILQLAQDEGAKLIVIGVQSRNAIDRLIFGSTTRSVMQAARCPVLSVRADRHAESWAPWPKTSEKELASAHS